MDLSLRCNTLKCRRHLNDRAVVTTCSHIFCVQCSDSLGLSNSTSNERICPACDTRLINADDAVATQLNPSEDYKTSVLSGLSPSVITECAGRGLAFYSYQATQEILYQEFLAKSLTDKYGVLSSQMDRIIHDANAEIVNLRSKVSGLQQEQDTLRKNNDELLEAYNEKVKSNRKSQALYDNLKKRMLQSDVQSAAADAADNLASVANDRHGDGLATDSRFRRHGAQFPIVGTSIEHGHGRRRSGSSGRGEPLRHIQHSGRNTGTNQWGMQAPNSMAATPAEHRTRLPVVTPQADRVIASRHAQSSFSFTGANPSQSSITQRQPFGNLDGNLVSNSGTSGYGLSAGMKIGRHPGSHIPWPSGKPIRTGLSNMMTG